MLNQNVAITNLLERDFDTVTIKYRLQYPNDTMDPCCWVSTSL